MGTILAASHHEIKNLVTLVKLSADQLARMMAAELENSPYLTMIQTLKDASNLLTDVARNMGQLIDPKAHDQKKSLALKELVESVTQLMMGRVKPTRLIVQPHRGAEDIWVLGHDVRIKQILINLIINAQDAIQQFDPPEGGKITLGWEHAQDGFAEVHVVDNGIGLSTPGERTEFQAFSSTKRLRGGQGLGLWLCSKMVVHLGGTLSLASQGVGRGAKATLRLPTTDQRHDSIIDLSAYLDSDQF